MNVENQKQISVSLDNITYTFDYIQDLIPIHKNGELYVYNHRDNEKYKERPKNKYGHKDYCKFKINFPKKISGVYLWIVDEQIIYIGEAKDLRVRFNTNYGHITPYNCTKKGQVTNCKMNNVVLELFKNENKIIHLYFMQTENHKEIESILLAKINTKYNSKNNK